MSSWISPLVGYEKAEPLPTHKNPDGKSLYNPPGPRSTAYNQFPTPIDNSNNGFDFHIYYMHAVESQKNFAQALHERVRREFPEDLHILGPTCWSTSDGNVEVNTFNPHQTGTFFAWLAVNRGPCSVLIHPNTNDPYKDHTELATWMGKPWPLNVEMLRPH